MVATGGNIGPYHVLALGRTDIALGQQVGHLVVERRADVGLRLARDLPDDVEL